MRSSTALACATLLCACAVGPSTPSAQRALSKLAAVELRCPEADLQVEARSGECGDSSWQRCAMQVRGCGSAVEYVYSDDGRWARCHTSEQSWPNCEEERAGEGP